MHQRLTCANCGAIALELFGSGWLEAGWISCKCGSETLVTRASATTTHRPILPLVRDPSIGTLDRSADNHAPGSEPATSPRRRAT